MESVTLQRVDQRIRFSRNDRGNEGGVMRSGRCNCCFRKECKELIPLEGLGIKPFMLMIALENVLLESTMKRIFFLFE